MSYFTKPFKMEFEECLSAEAIAYSKLFNKTLQNIYTAFSTTPDIVDYFLNGRNKFIFENYPKISLDVFTLWKICTTLYLNPYEIVIYHNIYFEYLLWFYIQNAKTMRDIQYLPNYNFNTLCSQCKKLNRLEIYKKFKIWDNDTYLKDYIFKELKDSRMIVERK